MALDINNQINQFKEQRMLISTYIASLFILLFNFKILYFFTKLNSMLVQKLILHNQMMRV